MTDIKPSKYKEDQRQGWNNVADGWMAEMVENNQECSCEGKQKMIELGGIKEVLEVLDISTDVLANQQSLQHMLSEKWASIEN